MRPRLTLMHAYQSCLGVQRPVLRFEVHNHDWNKVSSADWLAVTGSNGWLADG